MSELIMCHCGCQHLVNRGKQFRQGHDAKLKSYMLKAHRVGEQIILPAYPNQPMSARQAAGIYGWAHMITDRRARNNKKTVVADIGSARTVAKIGRWEYEVEVVEPGKDTTKIKYKDRQGNPRHTTVATKNLRRVS